MEQQIFLRRLYDYMQLATDRVCFVLGAGASKECGIPAAKELTMNWYRELLQNAGISQHWQDILCCEDEEARKKCISLLKDSPDLLSKVLHQTEWDENKPLKLEDFIRIKFMAGVTESYSELFAYRYPEEAMRERAIQKIVGKAQFKEGHKHLARILAGTKNNIAITTNFDLLIENAYSAVDPSATLMRLAHAQDQTCIAFNSNELNGTVLDSNKHVSLVIKAHCDIHNHGMINTPEEMRYLPDNFYEKLESVFSKYIPIFIGYAGTDIALMDMLLRFARSGKNKKKGCYWLIYGDESDKPEGKVSKRVKEYVTLVGGHFVMHSGFEDIMPLIASSLLINSNGDTCSAPQEQKVIDNITIERKAKISEGNAKISEGNAKTSDLYKRVVVTIK